MFPDFWFSPTTDVPHFRYTAGSRGPTVTLDSMCDHHEKVFAAHYVANHLHSFSLPGIDCTTRCTTDSLRCSRGSDYFGTNIFFKYVRWLKLIFQSLPIKAKERNQKTIVTKFSDLEYTQFAIIIRSEIFFSWQMIPHKNKNKVNVIAVELLMKNLQWALCGVFLFRWTHNYCLTLRYFIYYTLF